MNEIADSKSIIVILSGGRSCCKTAFISGIYLPAQYNQLMEMAAYKRFEKAMNRVHESMTAAFTNTESIIGHVNSMARKFAEQQEEIFREYIAIIQPGTTQKMADLLKEFEESLKRECLIIPDKEPLPRPHKIITVFNVYEAYTNRLNHKPVYYHIRSNC